MSTFSCAMQIIEPNVVSSMHALLHDHNYNDDDNNFISLRIIDIHTLRSANNLFNNRYNH